MDDAKRKASLPDDPQVLKAIILDLTRQRDEFQIKFLRLEVELLGLKKRYYGPKADKLQNAGEVAQLLLDFAVNLEARAVNPQDLPPGDLSPGELPPGDSAGEGALVNVSTSIDVKALRRVKGGRRKLADLTDLPTTRKVIDLPEDQKPCPCCGLIRQCIGQSVTYQIEYIPGHFERIEYVQLKYGCGPCDQSGQPPRIEQAEKPLQPIDKGMAGPGLLAHVVTAKYADYLPLYRLEAQFQRNGFEISRATLSIWCGDVADLIKPLYSLMAGRVLGSHLVCTDDTIMPMLDVGKTKKARMWVYVGDHHNPYNLFDFTLSRNRDGPAEFLKGYKNILLADAYGGYNGVVVGNTLTRAGCWAHARRKFVDAEKAHPAIAAEAVGLIGKLYAIEARGKDLDPSARLALRQRESVPILAVLKDRLYTWREQLLPKHPMAEAVNYTLNQWTELNVFAGDGAVPIDNNVSEREMKRIVLNRKNSLFVGNERGGQTAAILSSFTSTCRRHGIDPQRYLTQLLTNLPGTPMSQLANWLPDRWKITQAALAK